MPPDDPRAPFRARLRAAWNILWERPIRLAHVTIESSTIVELHACVWRDRDGAYHLMDNCRPQCDAQEARAMGGEIWERYAMDIEARAEEDL